MSLAESINVIASEKCIPLNVFVELTYRCNCFCYYCYQKHYEETAELDEKTWTRIFGELADMGTLNLTLSGGEPLLRYDFFSILKQARAYEFGISVISNGYLITEEVAGKLSDYGVVDIGISLHSSTAAQHDKLAGRNDSFRKALAAIRSLVKCGVKVLIKHSVSRTNFHEYTALQKLANDEGCSFECDSGILPSRRGEVSPYALSQEQLKIFFADMDIGIQTKCDTGFDIDESTLHCDAGRSVCGISPDGTVYPCIILPLPLGTLQQQSFEEIWYGEKAASFRYEEIHLDMECYSCTIRHLCSRCHGFAWLETGNWKGKSFSLCERAKAFA